MEVDKGLQPVREFYESQLEQDVIDGCQLQATEETNVNDNVIGLRYIRLLLEAYENKLFMDYDIK